MTRSFCRPSSHGGEFAAGLRTGFSLSTASALFLAACMASAATFDVTNTADSGGGSLTQAILDANGSAGPDTITFHIGNGVQTITPGTQLPIITDSVVIDGSTQPGFSGTPLIEISGATLSNNGNGLVVGSGAGGSTIRSLVINHGWSRGIIVQASNCIIQGCFLGTDLSGTSASGNTIGVATSFPLVVTNTLIGGTTGAARNVISGNNVGVFLDNNATNNLIQGNFIGTDLTGDNVIGNSVGVDLRDNNNTIGGNTVEARNIIAGGAVGSAGIIIASAATGNLIQGNFIGTDRTGTKAFGFSTGVRLDSGTTNTLVGGITSTPGTPPGNVISASRASGGSGSGIDVALAGNNNVIQGNLIGTDASGTSALGNGLNGISIQGSSNLVGGNTATARNVISGNGLAGITLGSNNTSVSGNVIQNNFIGTKIDGVQLLGNGTDGIYVVDSTNTNIGGLGATPPGNVIAGNGGAGVNVDATFGPVTGAAIRGNSIFSNGGLGIDLGNNGVTLNDALDVDTGANNLQNFPAFTSQTRGPNFTNFSGTFDSAPNTTYHLEFFANDVIDPSGFGEGQTFLVAIDVTTNANGHVGFGFQTGKTIAPGQKLTATATDPSNNTSEFSPPAPGQLTNISTRLRVLTGDNVLIGGFFVNGTGSKKVVLRAIGPSLANPPFNLSGVLADPTIEVHDAAGVIMTNDNWRDTQQSEIAATGLAPTNDLESAVVLNLPAPASYTAIVRGNNSGTGIGQVEVFDADLDAQPKLTNISTRGFVDNGDNVMIGGFVIGGTGGPINVVVRAIGPSLFTQFHIQGALMDPILTLFDEHGTQIASNDNWKDTQQTAIEATQLQPIDDHESATLASLAHGSYTAIVRGLNQTTGVGLVEVFEVP